MKRKVSEFPESLLTDLKNQGLTYSGLMNYGMTRWGARKLTDHDMVQAEEAGNHEKIFYLKNIDGKETTLSGTYTDFKNLKIPAKEEEVNHEEETRTQRSAKQTITNKANTYLTELEREVKNTDINQPVYNPPEYSSEGFTAIIHETDSHFSAHVKNRKGETTYNTDIAKQATHDAFKWYRKEIVNEASRRELDNVVILLGGDLVEGENIYEGQAHKVEDSLEKQIKEARQTYFEEIRLTADTLGVPVKVVCVSGNHGDLPVSSSSNADDLIYSMLEDMIAISSTDNVKFVKSDRTDGLTFNYRGWKGYLCHGENRSNHIGTSSPQSDWFAMKDQYGFDAAWRGHYHTQKEESVNGTPVYMTNSRKPGDDYTDKIAAFGKTGNALYFATDEEPVSEVKKQTDVL